MDTNTECIATNYAENAKFLNLCLIHIVWAKNLI